MSRKFWIFNSLAKWKCGDLPGNTFVKLVLNENLGIESGFQAITTSLASDEEIDYAVDQLQRDLEFARNQAKRTLRRQQMKINASLQQ